MTNNGAYDYKNNIGEYAWKGFHRVSRPLHSTTLPLLRQEIEYWVSAMLSSGYVKNFWCTKSLNTLLLCAVITFLASTSFHNEVDRLI